MKKKINIVIVAVLPIIILFYAVRIVDIRPVQQAVKVTVLMIHESTFQQVKRERVDYIKELQEFEGIKEILLKQTFRKNLFQDKDHYIRESEVDAVRLEFDIYEENRLTMMVYSDGIVQINGVYVCCKSNTMLYQELLDIVLRER